MNPSKIVNLPSIVFFFQACPGELSTSFPRAATTSAPSSSASSDVFTVRMAPIPARCHRSVVVEYNTRVDFDVDGVAHHSVPSSAGACDRLSVELLYHAGGNGDGGHGHRGGGHECESDDGGAAGSCHAPQLKLGRARTLTVTDSNRVHSPTNARKSIGGGLLDAHKQRPRFVWHPGRASTTGHGRASGYYRCFFERKSDLSSLEAFEMLRSVPAHRPSLDWQSPTRRKFDVVQKGMVS